MNIEEIQIQDIDKFDLVYIYHHLWRESTFEYRKDSENPKRTRVFFKGFLLGVIDCVIDEAINLKLCRIEREKYKLPTEITLIRSK